MRASIHCIAACAILLSACQASNHKTGSSLGSASSKGAKAPVSLDQKASKSVNGNPQDVVYVWDRIRLSMAMPIPNQALVNQYRDWFIRHPQHLELISQRARPFLYLIVEELEKRDLPIELALLPIVESSFNPLAYSSAAASGLWQFTSPMASHFGLDMNWWYDGRRDVPAATIAALDMLAYLYKKTDNWLYALAAYNCGEGRLRNAIRENESRGLSTDFWSLNLPKETRQYVPQLLALADVVKKADEYGINLNQIPNRPLVEVIDVGSQIDLAVAAELAQMPIERLQKLNPGFNRWTTSPDGPHQLIIPVGKANGFKQALAETKVSDRVQWFKYKIRAGDNISAIAKRHQTSTSLIQSMNDIQGDRIIAGNFLYMPNPATQMSAALVSLAKDSASQEVKAAPEFINNSQQTDLTKALASKSVQQSKSAEKTVNHTVKYGDTLWSLARAYQVSVEQIVSWNNMTDKDKLSEGKTLKLLTNVRRFSS
ncbi:Lytic transglycosylase, catalytic [Shewanella denitrificans OS217]|uniref:Lytic transglycosylase, catalytic n=1 Tax=Shewanella denitrificans (strain OS217 / ATCC BAA-1090 / DSM 15013) TaxID=318161 RepID=Q12N35_SHEDO|nr:LysM peptidoglycan-binding domain-containing protein [Shewanella denitrificans]ABE55141.1 Lytic transglycosylase, catalytic [Shewanella denitrificans OS217]